MLGTTVTRKSDRAKFTITGYDEAAATYTLAPDAFGPNVAVPASELRAQFSGVGRNPDPTRTNETTGWKKIGEVFTRAAHRRPHAQRADGLLTPEQVLNGEARDRAEEIAADPDRLADFAVGLLPVSQAVGVELDRILEERASVEDRAAAKRDRDDDAITTADAKRLGHGSR